jgi:predicted peroxiredoxin
MESKLASQTVQEPGRQVANGHLVIINAGKEDQGARATLAFGLAISLHSMGSDVSIYLDAAGAIWALEDAITGVAVRGFEPLASYVGIFNELGAQTYVHHAALTQLPGWDESRNRHTEYGAIRRGVVSAGGGNAGFASTRPQEHHVLIGFLPQRPG